MESINDQLLMLDIAKDVLNTSDNLNDTIRVLNDIINIYESLSTHDDNVAQDIWKPIEYAQKAVNLRTLLTQLELQNEALISRMKSIIE